MRQHAVALGQQQWAALGAFVAATLPDPLDPLALLPVATGLATGGAVAPLVEGAALVVLSNLALRIFDDYADQDDPHAVDRALGPGRALNYALTLNNVVSQAFWQICRANPQLTALYELYLQAWLAVCHGQDLDLQLPITDLGIYREVVKHKTVVAYEFAALVGAYLAAAQPPQITLCQQCGQHLGWMAQILDDIEALWFPLMPSAAALKPTYPLLWGLTQPEPAAQALATYYQSPNPDRLQLCALLDEMHIRGRLMNVVLHHRDQALALMAQLPEPAGKIILEHWLNWLLREGQNLMTRPPVF